MAWRIDTSGDLLYRTASLPSTVNFTVCGWAFVIEATPHPDPYGPIFNFENTAYPTDSSSWSGLLYGSSDQLRLATSGGNTDFPSTPSTSTWYFWACTCS